MQFSTLQYSAVQYPYCTWLSIDELYNQSSELYISLSNACDVLDHIVIYALSEYSIGAFLNSYIVRADFQNKHLLDIITMRMLRSNMSYSCRPESLCGILFCIYVTIKHVIFMSIWITVRYTVLYYIPSYCTVRHFPTLFYIELYWIVLCITLYFTALYCAVLHCTVLYCTVLHCVGLPAGCTCALLSSKLTSPRCPALCSPLFPSYTTSRCCRCPRPRTAVRAATQYSLHYT